MFLLLLLITGHCCAQERRELVTIEKVAQPTFTARGEAKPPPNTNQSSVKKFALDWIADRATSKPWKIRRFEYVGELQGRPGDWLKAGRYDVYRITFQGSPDIGGEPQEDLLLYGQGKELLWPPEEWPTNKPPPGQMMAIVRNNLGIHQ